MGHYHIQITSLVTIFGKRWYWQMFTREGRTLLATSKAYKSKGGAWNAGGRLYKAIQDGECTSTFTWNKPFRFTWNKPFRKEKNARNRPLPDQLSLF